MAKETRDKILFISFKTFLNKGYEHTTMKDLVLASGLSKGAFYHYFSNKEMLYNAVIDTYFLAYFQEVEWGRFKDFSFSEIETNMKLFYTNFVNEICSFSSNGLSNYFVMFYQANEIHPQFSEDIQAFYLRLEKEIDCSLKKENIKKKAINLIAKYEGILFWLSIFPKEKIDKLIAEL